MDRILNMILRRVLNIGVNKGIDAVANRGRRGADQTPEDREMARKGKQSAKTMRQASNVIRRINRF